MTTDTRAPETFALTPMQHAYWIGRRDDQPLGGVACHAYYEFDGTGLDIARLDDTFRTLVARHEMLRVEITEDGRQRIRPSSSWPGVTVHDLRDASPGAIDRRLEALRSALSHRRLDVARGEVFGCEVALLPDGAHRMFFDIDVMVADLHSVRTLMTELATVYTDPAAPLPELNASFPAYLEDRNRALPRRREAAVRYWKDRLDTLPPGPSLPLVVDPDAVRRPQFRHDAYELSEAQTDTFRARCRQAGLTPSVVLATAYALVLGRWSERKHFSLSLPTFARVGDAERMIGEFGALTLLEVDTSEPSTFLESAKRIRRRLNQDLSHTAYTGIEVLRDLARTRPGERVGAPVVFGANMTEELVPPLFAERFGAPGWAVSQTPQVWLDYQAFQLDGRFVLAWDSVGALFPDGLIDDMFAAHTELLQWLTGPGTDWDTTPPVSIPPRQRSTRERVNATGPGLPPRLLHEPFFSRAEADPSRIALRWGDDSSMTYGELAGRAHAVAASIIEAGTTTPGELVGIVMERGWAQIAAVYGVLLAGRAYVPIDTHQPAARRETILANAGVRIVLTDPASAGLLDSPPGVRVLEVGETITSGIRSPLAPAADPASTAYVIYTSGSTGQPKGVVVSHRAAANTVDDITRRFAVGEDDRGLALANLGFDLSVYDIFGLLGAGGCLVLTGAGRQADPASWAELCSRHGVTFWNSVPAQLQMLDNFLAADPVHQPTSLRIALLSGDWIPVSLPDSFKSKVDGVRLVSLGGATEAGIWSIYHEIDETPDGRPSIPYGKPLSGQTFHVLDGLMADQPDFVPGELYIGGVSLADGYLADEEKTAAHFVRHPRTGRRLYRTGDYGRYHPDGTIEFLGRRDSQVKIRGHRVELSEIETALHRHPDVAQAAVLATGSGPGHRTLVAFAEPKRKSPEAPDTEPARVISAVSDTAVARPVAPDLAAFRGFQERLDRVSLLSMASALRETGLFAGPGQKHSLSEVLTTARVAPRFHRLARRWLHALCDQGHLHRDGDAYHGLVPVTGTELADAWDRLEKTRDDRYFPRVRLDYLRGCAAHLPALLRGETEPIGLFFPEGSTDVAYATFAGNPPSDHVNAVAAGFTRWLVAGSQTRSPARVIELGAGVGATTKMLAPRLSESDAEYLFTDVSHFFLAEAERKFGDLPGMSFGLFDINSTPREQSFPGNDFDVVLAANVLHNADDLGRTLDGISELLAPGGWLVFLDGTEAGEFPAMMISMEFLVTGQPGDDFADFRSGHDQLFPTVDQWCSALREAGAAEVLVAPSDDDPFAEFGQRVFAARFKTDRHRLDTGDLRGHLAERVPAHMIPAEIEIVDELPTTGNGKVDRRRLATWAEGGGLPRQERIRPPGDDLEGELVEIWSETLGGRPVGTDQDFFALGGDSLLVAKLVATIRDRVAPAGTLSFEDILATVLATPTVVAMAEFLRKTT
ncbi:amino acid adenylation domain-containing protein [Amycolatopsis sp. EV170708-02-1]|uniref:non-ribosomal peptide synthetase n=1 Tax=Amycolatopsis sp. EV170708-02-1 TaxID=2919322 RepID=UPI001F0CDAA4|nr:amino acid adenylation domain-containing protein [Amycolatopsis sp. EV170708-02-1]UMP01321.1 amino acid adenylation domain-containing protein [Amycolatopsis sp. EV170708-02-1]